MSGTIVNRSAARVAALTVLLAMSSVTTATPTLAGAPTRAADGVHSLGVGSRPGLAVDAVGTAYVAWNGPETSNTLHFCKVPRGTSACEPGIATTISTFGSSVTRPFVTVSGSTVRVLSYRFPASPGTYLYTSTDGGVTFDGGIRVGTVPFNEAVDGPGDTVSGVTDAQSTGMLFENVPLTGGVSDGPVQLSTTHPYTGAVGLFGDYPVVTFSDGDRATQYRVWSRQGPITDPAYWTGVSDVGYAAYPKLAGGPRGLYLAAGLEGRRIFVRKYETIQFGAPLSLGAGDPQNQDLFQDAAGRLHLVVERNDANGLHLLYWISDGDGAWRSETLATQNAEGAFNEPRVATAADHVGVAVWQASATGDIRMVALGPDVRAPEPGLSSSSSAKRSGSDVVVKAAGKLKPPTGVTRAKACRGDVRVTIKRGSTVLARKSDAVDDQCAFSLRKSLAAGKVGGAMKLKIVARFAGNRALAPTSTSMTVRVGG